MTHLPSKRIPKFKSSINAPVDENPLGIFPVKPLKSPL
jgi:hypothetical protein